jgi:hypothetical protein
MAASKQQQDQALAKHKTLEYNTLEFRQQQQRQQTQIGLALLLLLLLHPSWHGMADDPAFPLAGRPQREQDQALAQHKTLTAAPQLPWLACHIRLLTDA